MPVHDLDEPAAKNFRAILHQGLQPVQAEPLDGLYLDGVELYNGGIHCPFEENADFVVVRAVHHSELDDGLEVNSLYAQFLQQSAPRGFGIWLTRLNMFGDGAVEQGGGGGPVGASLLDEKPASVIEKEDVRPAVPPSVHVNVGAGGLSV